jgi:HEAT repeat protein
MQTTRTLAKLAVIAIAIVMMSTPAVAGDRIAELTTMLASSSNKTRLSAVVSLARLGDKRTMKPLVTALKDTDAQVRAIAASALGKLAHPAAYPALKAAATSDVDATVRTAAREAALAVAKANDIKDEFTDPPAPAVQAQAKTTGFGRSPHAVEEKADLYVTIKNANDDSPGKADKVTRKANCDVVKAVLAQELRNAPMVTTLAADAQRWGLEARLIDVSIVKLEQTQANGVVEVSAELRLSISDDKGKMMSFLSGGAKVQVPAPKYQAKYLPSMKRDAIEGAMRGMMEKLLAHLRKITTT